MPTVDLSEFESLASPNRRKPCAVESAKPGLNATDLKNLNAALEAARERVPTGAIEKWFAKRDLKVSASAITAHRTGKCRCGTDG